MFKQTLTALAICVAGGAASAATIDFEAFGAGEYGNSIVVDGHTITNADGGNVLVGAGAAGQDDGFCSLVPNQFNCAADTNLQFSGAVTNLSFDLDGSNAGDMVTISIYGIGDVFLGSQVYTTPDQNIDLSSYGAITRLFFDDNSTAAGYGYSTFRFDLQQVPLPAGGLLLISALGGLGYLRRKAA